MDCRVHGVAESQRQLSNFHFHFPIYQSLLFYFIRSVSEFEESMADNQRLRGEGNMTTGQWTLDLTLAT